MCGRYGFSVKDAREVYSRFDIANTLDDFEPRWNIAPGQMNPVITKHSPNRIERMLWRLIPFWSKDDSFKFKTINARSEGIADKPVYRKPFRYQRCLVPATFFYEWDKSKKQSVPYLFELKDSPIISFAGLYDIWKDPKGGKEISSYTIITTKANGVVGKIHERMPVILHQEDEEEWLNPDTIEPERILKFLVPYPDEEMRSFAVSNAVNNPRTDDKNLIKPVKQEQADLLNSN